MPAEGLEWLPRDELLTFDEIARVARICVDRYGFDGIRLTGGEPTLRRNIVNLVDQLAELDVDIAMTTNGTSLDRLAKPLHDAGLRRINVSCDSLRPERFAVLTRRDALAKVLEGIDAAVAAGFEPVKVNVVMMRGVNDDEAVDFAAFGRERGVQVRFIEFMPLDADGGWQHDLVVPRDEVVGTIGAVFPIDPVTRGHEPAERFVYRDGKGEIGVIASVSDAFCSSCDRIRLTADGMLRSCLFALDETDLRALLRAGATDDDLAAALQRGVGAKWAGHGIEQVTFVRPRRSMSQIGG